MNEVVLALAIIGVAGVGAQWLAWRWSLPAIVLLLVAGFLIGPATGVLSPTALFGDLLRPTVALGVAVILFEGGLSLNFQRIGGVEKAVWRLVLLGAFIAFLLSALNAHYIAELSWPSALVFAAILIVTGPTVIIPLLRQARLERRVSSLLRWEAILADPLGALLAVFMFEGYLVYHGDHGFWVLAIRAVAGLLIGGVGGWALGRGLIWLFVGGRVPEFLKVPLIFVSVMGAYALSDLVLEESGLLTVTVLGLVLGNSRLASLEELKRFKEAVTIILVSSVFIVLTASVQLGSLAEFRLEDLAFILVLLFVIRPISVWVGTIGAHLSWKERLLVGWIAPRGIVAVAVSGLFARSLVEHGAPDGERLAVLSFAVVVATVFAHGFSLGPFARWLGLSSHTGPGLLIVGASRFSVALATKLKTLDVPSLTVDRNWGKLRLSRNAGLANHYGEVLSEEVENELPLENYSVLLAVTDNDDYNALVTTNFGPLMGRGEVYQFAPSEEQSEKEKFRRVVTLGGRPFLTPEHSYNDLETKIREGWFIKASELTDTYGWTEFQEALPETAIVLMLIDPTKKLRPLNGTKAAMPIAGSTILSLVPCEYAAEREKTS
ncbi:MULTISPECIES: sodium:proton antiporter [unclassified Pseudovibrio]|uniref:cation:proton antiporter n=1 Tax=unclassified Pseudovibrio TaxID=2627060 RepID=UPI0007AE6E43|nr:MULTISPECIES: sodium:proton antiporter [unclassified Pseudovibrio]KZK94763.1 K(+)/H(+) antiporter NhaP [Pseudovibrio sp. W74]KZL04678.1 K(+)/H(+) antiporter NhaP [Pseudovibrio sp. Ad14]